MTDTNQTKAPENTGEAVKAPEPAKNTSAVKSILKANEKRFQDAAKAPADQTTALDIVAPSGGQLALTAHNNMDGTWSVTRGPGGAVLRDGLAKEQAIAIVGAPTNGETPANQQEEWAAKQRLEIEQETAERELDVMFKSDKEIADGDTGPENV